VGLSVTTVLRWGGRAATADAPSAGDQPLPAAAAPRGPATGRDVVPCPTVPPPAVERVPAASSSRPGPAPSAGLRQPAVPSPRAATVRGPAKASRSAPAIARGRVAGRQPPSLAPKQKVTAAGEHTVVTDHVPVGCGDPRGQAAQEVDGVEDQLGASGRGGPGPGELVDDPAVGEPREPLLGNRRAQSAAAEPLKPFAIVLVDGAGGMEREQGLVGDESNPFACCSPRGRPSSRGTRSPSRSGCSRPPPPAPGCPE